jgi:hypothetical protein
MRIEELHGALSGTDDLCGHSAAARGAAAAAPTWSAAAAAAETITAAAESVATRRAAESVPATKPITPAERIESFFAEAIPLVASPAATTSVKTHEP